MRTRTWLGLHLLEDRDDGGDHVESLQPAGLAVVRQSIGRQGVVEEVETFVGPALLQRAHLNQAPPGGGDFVTRRIEPADQPPD